MMVQIARQGVRKSVLLRRIHTNTTTTVHQTLRYYSTHSLHSRYMDMVNKDDLKFDEKQYEAIELLERVASGEENRGLYMYGSVGLGKTMILNLFHEHCSKQFAHMKSKRVHFHAFMLDFHRRMHQWRQENVHVSGRNALPDVARSIAAESKILCFDEFQVTDAADAMILKRLFGILFDEGCIVVTTSNRPPDDLYLNGINRPYFLPFIKLLKDRCHVLNMNQILDDKSDTGGTSIDYRTQKSVLPFIYNSPLTDENRSIVTNLFQSFCEKAESKASEITFQSGFRKVHVPLATPSACMYDFKQLCEKDLGAIDYIAIAEKFKTVFIQNIPQFHISAHNMNENMARFIILIDILYEMNVCVVCSSEVPLAELFHVDNSTDAEYATAYAVADDRIHDSFEMRVVKEGGSSGSSTTMIHETEWSATGRKHASMSAMAGNKNLAFAFKRTVSRLQEMQSPEYTQRNCNHPDVLMSKTQKNKTNHKQEI